ncbi:MAG TPA: PAS domain-containing protein, partial [Spirochaetota bacterium]|nr:PAS domain-containing protein [Spirochaetota bacterium]
MSKESDILTRRPDDDFFVFNHSIEEIFLLSREGTIIAANPAAAAGLGYEPDDLAGMDYRRIDETMRFDIAGWADDFIKRIGDSGGFTFESIHRTRSGEEKFKRIKITAFKKDNSDCFCIFALDISARMKSELDILRSRERFRNLFEQSFDMIFLINRNGKIVEWNQTIEKLSGISKIDAV